MRPSLSRSGVESQTCQMRTARVAIVALLLALAAVACAPTKPGWQGADVHLVNGTWIGTESACHPTAEEDRQCRAFIREALGLIEPSIRDRVVRTAVAALPTTFVTASGEVIEARLHAGIATRAAVVIDLADGARHVVGMWCHAITEATCDLRPLDWWLDGNQPPPIRPGAQFG
jgi:hypothetical protein